MCVLVAFAAASADAAKAAGRAMDLVPAAELSLFTADEPMEFAARFDTAQEAGQLIWRLFDVDGKVVRTGTVDTPAAAPGVTIRLAPLPVGYFEFQATAPGRADVRRSFVVCPPDRPYRNPCFGVDVTHLTHIMRANPDKAMAILRASRRLGFSWVRALFTWEDVSPRQDVWDWRIADAFVDQCLRLDMLIVPGLFYTPSWASTAPSTARRPVAYMPDPEALAMFCQTAARRYAGKITWWESWNEPDAELFWKGRPTSTTSDAVLTDLAELSRIAYESVRRGNPKAKILAFGATGPRGHSYKPFLKTMMDKGTGKHFDALSVHYMADLDRCRRLLRAADAPTRIWITEIGGGDRRDGGPLGHIRADVVQTVWQWTHGAERVAKFFLWPIGIDPDMSLFRKDQTPKPAAAGWAVLNDRLRKAEPRGEVDIVRCSDRGYLRAVAFDTPQGPVTVAWLEFARAATCRLPARGDVTVVDALGRSVPIKRSNGAAAFELGVLPVYVCGTIDAPKRTPTYPNVVTAYGDVRTETLRSATFEGSAADVFRQGAPGSGHWWVSSDVGKATKQMEYSLDLDMPGEGGQSLHVRAARPTDWPCVEQILPVRRIGRPLGEHETLAYHLKGMLRLTDIVGRGAFIEISYLDASRKRIWPPAGTPMESGTKPWHDVDTGWRHVNKGTQFVAVRCYLGMATGRAWFDAIELTSAVHKNTLQWHR